MQTYPPAEHPLSPATAAALIESAFPDLAPAQVSLIGEGWDSTAWLVNGTWVFRFPRRQLGAECLEAEIAVMPRAAPRLPLAVSAPQRVGGPRDGFPWRFAGYPMIPWRTACSLALDAAARARLAAPLGRFLRALHAIDAEQALAWGAPPDELRRLDVAHRVPRTTRRLEHLRARDLLDTAPLLEVLRRSEGLPPARAHSLVHGDLYARHLILDEAGTLRGVIDWGDVHAGDPAVDLSIAHAFLPPAARPAFREAYGPIDPEIWALARFRACAHAATVAVAACENGDEDLLRESLVGLANVVAG